MRRSGELDGSPLGNPGQRYPSRTVVLMGQEPRGDFRLDTFGRFIDARAVVFHRLLELIGETEDLTDRSELPGQLLQIVRELRRVTHPPELLIVDEARIALEEILEDASEGRRPFDSELVDSLLEVGLALSEAAGMVEGRHALAGGSLSVLVARIKAVTAFGAVPLPPKPSADIPPEEMGRKAGDLAETVDSVAVDYGPVSCDPQESPTPFVRAVSGERDMGPPLGTRPGFLPAEVARLLGAFVHDLRGHNNIIGLSTSMASREIIDKYSDNLIILDFLEEFNFIRVYNQNITNLLTAMASLSRDWTEEPLTKEVMSSIHEQLVRTTDFEFDVEYPENIIINDLLIYADGFFSMSLLILQDLLNSIGSLREPRMSIRYMILCRELITVATFATTPSNQHHPVPFRKDLTRFITDAFRGKLASSQVDGSWEVYWSFPLERAEGRP
jgi:hypothetical protein